MRQHKVGQHVSIVYISRGATCWLVDFAKSHHAGDVLRLFGTTVIPAPFTPAAREADVLNTVQTNNPDCIVLVRR